MVCRPDAEVKLPEGGGDIAGGSRKPDRAKSGGITLYEGNEIVWLADHVPPEFVDAPQV